jgi:16S rRNA (cytidine1402-2'-O)-methyltransferase
MSKKLGTEGKFYVVATPIGNKADITVRALEVLRDSEIILCENSKKTIPLLKDLGISNQAKTLHRSQDMSYYNFILEGIQDGKNYSLVSDAGTPGISDPGAQVVRYLRSQGIPSIPIPGPSALAAILSISGYQANPTLFLGFLSEKKGKKKNQLEKAKQTDGLIVCYESVHKMPALIEILVEIFPDREILVGREMTKLHEEVLYYENSRKLQESPPKAKGEFTILINNHEKFSLKDSPEEPIVLDRG